MATKSYETPSQSQSSQSQTASDAKEQTIKTFKAFSNGEVQTYQLVINNQAPVKIGDGTFGSVFKAKRGKDDYAVKVFYDKADQYEAYKKELDAGELIVRKLKELEKEGEKGIISLSARLVLPIANTSNFSQASSVQANGSNQPSSDNKDKDSAYEYLKQKYQNSLSLSQYALVMELFESSLKDWLERGRSINQKRKPGYKILCERERPIAHREAFALWVVKQIAEGTLALHLAGYHHHDLKPANILMRSRGGDLDVALADIGFLHTKNQQSSTISVSPFGSPSGGTRHYRSSEQRDYFDVCDAEVIPISGGGCELRIRDPKFEDSLTEPNDSVQFSRALESEPYSIEKVAYPEMSQKTSSQIAITAAEEAEQMTVLYLKPNQKANFRADERTQIVIQKRHTTRTDLFGLGALLYDIITGGRSPERFYDRIRSWDRKGNRIIDTLLRNYHLRVDDFQSVSPEFNYVFDLLKPKGNSSYPSKETVKILLRLMLSKPGDSYFSSVASDKGADAIKAVISDLEAAILLKGATVPSSQNIHNTLWRNESHNDPNGQKENPTELYEDIKSLQKCVIVKNRLECGYFLLTHLFRFIGEYARGTKMYYANMSPRTNLFYQTINQRKLFRTGESFIYRTPDEFLNGLIDDTLPSLPSGAGLFSPYYVNNLYRRAQVKLYNFEKVIESGPARAELNGELTVHFFDNHPLWRTIEKDDVIVFRFDGTPPRIVLRVTKPAANGRHEFSEWVRPSDGKKSTIAERIPLEQATQEAMIIRPIVPHEYYLAVLGVFVHHLFFVDENTDQGFAPSSYFSVEQSMANGDFDDRSIGAWVQRIKNPKGRGSMFGTRHVNNKMHEKAYETLADLYLLLVTRFFHGRAASGISDRISFVQHIIEQIGELLVLGAPSEFQQRAQLENIDLHQRLAQTLKAPTKSELPSLDKLLRSESLGDVSLKLRA